MKKIILTLSIFLITYSQDIVDYDCSCDTTLVVYDWKFLSGDDEKYSGNDFDDSKWNKLIRKEDWNLQNSHEGIFWLRNNFRFQNRDEVSIENQILYTMYTTGSAYELYLNGKVLIKNGKVGKSIKSEIPGKYVQQIILPDSLLKEINTIAIRVSNFHYPNRNYVGTVKLSKLSSFYESNLIWTNELILVCTVLLLSALFNFLFFIGLKYKWSYLYFSMYCFFASFKLLLKYYFFVANVDITTQYSLSGLTELSFVLTDYFLIVFLIQLFQLKNKTKLFIAALFFAFLNYYLFMDYHVIVTITIAFTLVSFAIYNKQKNSILTIIGLIGFSICTYLGYEDQLSWGYFIGIIFFISCMFLVSVRQMIEQTRIHNESTLRSSRLENQLLKKNIQPHFLMNSLVSLQELIHEDSEKASHLIDSLADEFHLFSKVSEKKLIPLRDELKICEAHMKIMEFRKDAKFELIRHGIDGNEKIPPAIFHTMIENGISHGYGKKKHGKFVITKVKIENGIKYTMTNDGDIESDTNCRKNGTGMKYVKARLEESYGNKFRLSQGATDEGWQVILELYEEAK